jgi:hypothetical protein
MVTTKKFAKAVAPHMMTGCVITFFSKQLLAERPQKNAVRKLAIAYRIWRSISALSIFLSTVNRT